MMAFLRSLLCLMYFAHPMVFERNDTKSDLAADDSIESYYKSVYGPYAKYYQSACQGKPLCNSTIIHPTVIDKGSYKCSCNPDCSIYGDCCPDSQTTNVLNNKSNDAKVFSCIPQLSIYVVKTCPTSFTDTVTRMKCENISVGQTYEDGQLMRPVMDTKSFVTYLNAYCASCNNVTHYETFELSYRCASFKKIGGGMMYLQNSDRIPYDQLLLVLPKVKFNPESKIFTTEINDTIYDCSHKVIIPTHLRSHLRDCVPRLISTCPKAFTDSDVIEKCHSSIYYVVYTSPFVGQGEVYRNEYCAKCNGIESVLHCQTASPHAGGSGSSSLWMTSSDTGTCADPEMKTLSVCQ